MVVPDFLDATNTTTSVPIGSFYLFIILSLNHACVQFIPGFAHLSSSLSILESAFPHAVPSLSLSIASSLICWLLHLLVFLLAQ
jgi:hypothetical protein